MAIPTEIPFDQFEILIGNGAVPEQFERRCLVNAERGASVTPEYNDVLLPDCDDERLPSVVRKYVTQVSAEITGNGVVSPEDVAFFFNWALSGETRNVRAIIGTLQISFGAKLGGFNPTSSRDDIVNSEISLMSDGVVEITEAP